MKYVKIKDIEDNTEQLFIMSKEEVIVGDKITIRNLYREFKAEVIEIFESKEKISNNGKINIIAESDEKITDPQEVIKRVRYNLSNLLLACDELRNDRNLINKILNNKSIMSKYKNDEFAILEYIGDGLKKDKFFAKSLMKPNIKGKHTYRILKYFDLNLLEDEELIFYALECEYSGETNVYEYIGEGLKHNKSFLLKLIKKRYNYYSLLDDDIKNDYNFNYEIVLQDYEMLAYMNKEFRCDEKFIAILKSKEKEEIEKLGHLYNDYLWPAYIDKRDIKNHYHNHTNNPTDNKIIIDEQYFNCLIRNKENSNSLELDFTLLDDSDAARKCNSYITNVQFKHINHLWIISFVVLTNDSHYNTNDITCFEVIIEKLFAKLKHNINWYYKSVKILDSKYAYYPNYFPYYPTTVARLFYDNGNIADEYILNSPWLYDEEKGIDKWTETLTLFINKEDKNIC